MSGSIMWALTAVLWLLGSLLTDAAAVLSSPPPSPADVVFSSVNLRNVVQWRPGNDTPPGTHFSVQYAIYGDKAESGKSRRRVNWRAVQHCRHVGRSWCDLTNETRDLEHGYYARVRAEDEEEKRSSRWTQTQRRFDPKPDTSFGPPMVSVAMEENCAIIHLKGPMRYQPDNHTPEVSMATFYPKQMTYNVSVHNAHRNHTRHFTVRDSQYKYQLMDYETEYCFSAKASFLAMPVPCQASPWHCISTPQDPLIGQLHRVVVGIVVPSVCVCVIAVAGYLLYRSVWGRDHKTPNNLRFQGPLTAHPPLTFYPENTKLMTVNDKHLSVSRSSLSYNDQTQLHPPDPSALPDLLSYAPQGASSPREEEEEEENHFPRVEPAAVDYGFVGEDDGATAPEGGEGGGGEEGGSDGGGEDGEDAGSEGRQRKETRRDRPGPAYAPQTALRLARASTQPAACPTHAENRTPLGAHGVRALRERLEGGIFVKRDPRTGRFQIALPGQARRERAGADGENETAGTAEGGRDAAGAREREEERDVGGDRGREAGRTRGDERETRVSPYALQCSEGRPAPQPRGSQWGDSQDDYALLASADGREAEETEEEMEEEEEEEEEEGTNCVDWDPETGRLLLVPPMEKEMEEGEGLDGRTGPERGCGEEEEREARLESVLVRQASGEEKEEEEEEEEERRQEGETEGGSWETDTMLSRWSLKVHMDQ